MTAWLALGLGPLLAGCSTAQTGAPVAQEDLAANMDDWLIEKWDKEPVRVDLKDGKLHISTEPDNGEDGVMVWLKRDLPANFTFEYDFTPLSEHGFYLIFFCAQGLNGQDVTSPQMQARGDFQTLFIKYTGKKAPSRSYHISYRRGNEANCNLRKNPGLNLLKQTVLDQLLPQDKTVHVKLTKRDKDIKLEVGGKTFMEYTDNDQAYSGGRLALRQVYRAEALYSNMTLTEIK